MGIPDTYDPTLNLNGGYLVESDHPNPAKRIGDNGKTLLHLLYWLTYTEPGRNFLRDFKPSKESPLPVDRKPEGDVVTALRNKFLEDYDIRDANVLNALIQMHIHGTYLVDEMKKVGQGDATAAARRDVHESNYKTYLSVITWQLWQDGTDHEFSMAW